MGLYLWPSRMLEYVELIVLLRYCFHTHFTCHSHSQFSPVFLYNCTSVVLAHDCSECVSLPPELSCGYCSLPAQCLHSTLCSAPNTFIGSQQDTGQCPVQFEVSRELTHSVSVLNASFSLLRSKLSSVCVTPHHISVTGFQQYTHVKHMSQCCGGNTTEGM